VLVLCVRVGVPVVDNVAELCGCVCVCMCEREKERE